jgi:hypothetical protein
VRITDDDRAWRATAEQAAQPLPLVAQNNDDSATNGSAGKPGRSYDQRRPSVIEQLFRPAEPGRTAGGQYDCIEFSLR